MQNNFDAMQIAQRVLTALTKKRPPDKADVVALREFVGPQSQDAGPDELACDVIQKAMKQRTESRGA